MTTYKRLKNKPGVWYEGQKDNEITLVEGPEAEHINFIYFAKITNISTH